MSELKPVTEKLQPKSAGAFKKFMRVVTLIVVLILSGFFWWQYYFIFGEGVKSGELNFLVRKGNVFKTYEGKLIQTGFRSKAVGSIQSYEFEFSVVDDSIANVLMKNSGSYFDLHYKEYKGSLPWRGYSPYIVDKILVMKTIDR